MRIIAFVVSVLSPLLVQGQTTNCSFRTDSLTKVVVSVSPHQTAKPEGGIQSLGKAISKGLVYPEIKAQQPIETKTIVCFIIDADGTVKGERVVVPGVDGVAQQVLNIVKSLTWHAATCSGKPVASLYALPVDVHLTR